MVEGDKVTQIWVGDDIHVTIYSEKNTTIFSTKIIIHKSFKNYKDKVKPQLNYSIDIFKSSTTITFDNQGPYLKT
jgi:hypothetical protein